LLFWVDKTGEESNIVILKDKRSTSSFKSIAPLHLFFSNLYNSETERDTTENILLEEKSIELFCALLYISPFPSYEGLEK